MRLRLRRIVFESMLIKSILILVVDVRIVDEVIV
jgi:hypothetical protein